MSLASALCCGGTLPDGVGHSEVTLPLTYAAAQGGGGMTRLAGGNGSRRPNTPDRCPFFGTNSNGFGKDVCLACHRDAHHGTDGGRLQPRAAHQQRRTHGGWLGQKLGGGERRRTVAA